MSDWKEKVFQIADFHSQQVAIHGRPRMGSRKNGWSLRDTASHFSVSVATVSFDLRLAEELRKNPERYKSIQSRAKAIEEMNRKNTDLVEFKYARIFLTGRLLHSFEYDGHTYYMIQLNKPIETKYFDINILTVPSYHVRRLRE